jgi:hypothetical protein
VDVTVENDERLIWLTWANRWQFLCRRVCSVAFIYLKVIIIKNLPETLFLQRIWYSLISWRSFPLFSRTLIAVCKRSLHWNITWASQIKSTISRHILNTNPRILTKSHPPNCRYAFQEISSLHIFPKLPFLSLFWSVPHAPPIPSSLISSS